jgi:hypothetical protein
VQELLLRGGPLLLVITVQLLGKVEQVRMAGQDAVHATLRNYYQFMNPLYSNSSALEPTSLVEISDRFSYRNLVTYRCASRSVLR